MYNALTIHGLAVGEQLPSSVLEVAGFWSVTCYNIGGLVYSLDDIEHGILRGELCVLGRSTCSHQILPTLAHTPTVSCNQYLFNVVSLVS